MMKFSNVIKLWEIVHTKETGDLGFCDLEKAIREVEGVENDINPCQPSLQTATPAPSAHEIAAQMREWANWISWKPLIVLIEELRAYADRLEEAAVPCVQTVRGASSNEGGAPSPTLAGLVTPEGATDTLREWCHGHYLACPIPRSVEYLIKHPNEKRCIYNCEKGRLIIEPPASAKLCHALWERAKEKETSCEP